MKSICDAPIAEAGREHLRDMFMRTDDDVSSGVGTDSVHKRCKVSDIDRRKLKIDGEGFHQSNKWESGL